MSHTTVVVVVPGMGDDVQALKAGILEVGDVFVVNKADREGADKTVRELQAMLGTNRQDAKGWQYVVLKTQAHQNEGILELRQKLEDHQYFLSKEQLMERVFEERVKRKLLDELQYLIIKKTLEKVERNTSFDNWVRLMQDKEEDPYSLAEKLVKEFMK
jgi:LAO/AO transport system kinase